MDIQIHEELPPPTVSIFEKRSILFKKRSLCVIFTQEVYMARGPRDIIIYPDFVDTRVIMAPGFHRNRNPLPSFSCLYPVSTSPILPGILQVGGMDEDIRAVHLIEVA
jgi:hypothetical protein